MTEEALRVAQYLRKSSEHQRYSLENQAAAIGLYALQHRCEIVRTYVDAGRSGLTFKGRPGLKALIADVVGPETPFEAVLVFDVSRWGRYQDPDQAAHYEFLCREAGVQVRYCGESFENDGSLSSSIMKHLKRVMAAEYSRDLGVRVIRGQRRIASLGYSAGGPAPYGFRRELVDADGRTRMILAPGQRKGTITDRVRLVAGPEAERKTVAAIFRMYVHRRLGLNAIVGTLQASDAPPPPGGWSVYKVAAILSNDIYRGIRVYGRTTARLRTRRRPTPAAEWVKAHVAQPLVTARTFARAQVLRRTRYRRRTREEVVDALRRVMAREGRLTSEILDRSPDAPNKAVVQAHCGSLPAAFALAGQPLRRGQRKWRRETLIEELRRVQAAQGAADETALARDPLAPVPQTFVRHFGSLQAAQAAAGVPTTPRPASQRKPRRSTESLLAELRRLQIQKGRLSWADIEADPGIPARTVRRRLGGLGAVRAALAVRPGR